VNPVQALQTHTVRAAIAAGDYPADRGGELIELITDPARDAGRELSVFLRAVLRARGPDLHGYLGGQLGYGPERAVRARHHCGRRLLVLHLVPHELPDAVRDFYVCERCGPAFAVPTGTEPPRVRLEGPGAARVTLAAPLPATGWVAAGRQPIGGHHEPQPAPWSVAEGTTELSLRLPADQEPGIRRFAAALVCQGDVVIVQFPLHR
jgi:hypothetical protein